MQLEVKTMAELLEKNITPNFLYWVGSAGSFDDRAKKITRAFCKNFELCECFFWSSWC